MLALIELGDTDPELFEVYLTALDERARPAPAPPVTAVQTPAGKRPLAPAASRAEINAFFTKGR